MPWKNGGGFTTQICIHPPTATLAKNDFLYRLSSAPIEKDGKFSVFTGKKRILVPIKGAGFQLNSEVYEKFEIAQFSGDSETQCSLLKGPVVDFGIIYDSRVQASAKVLHLKSDFSFTLEEGYEHFFIILDGQMSHAEVALNELEGLHYTEEKSCHLVVPKKVVLFYASLRFKTEKLF